MSDGTRPVATRTMALVAVLLLVAMSAASAWVYVGLPPDAAVPTHWNGAGQVDGYSGRLAGLFGPVLITAVTVALLLAVPSIEPRRRNLQRSAGAYRVMYYAVLALLVGVHASILAAALGWVIDPGRFIVAGAGVLLVVLGNWLPTVRSNFMFGVRTPWTLTSDYTWRRTHRVAGRAMIALGVVLIGATVVGVAAGAALVGVGAALFAVGIVAYSYLVWRTAPDRGAPRA